MNNSSKISKKSQQDYFYQCDQLLQKIETSLQENIENISELEKIKPDLKNTQESDIIRSIRNFLSKKPLKETIEKLQKAKEDITNLRTKMQKEVSEEEDKLVRKLEEQRRKNIRG